MKHFNYTIDSLVKKAQATRDGSADACYSKRQIVNPNSQVRIEKQGDQSDGMLSVEGLYDNCSIFIDNGQSVILTNYEDGVSYLGNLFEEFKYDETIPYAYVFGGNPGHLFNILQAFHTYEIPVRGGYIDFFTGYDGLRMDGTEDWFGDLLREFLEGVGGTKITVSDLSGLLSYERDISRKDIDVCLKDHTIQLSVSSYQYERITKSSLIH